MMTEYKYLAVDIDGTFFMFNDCPERTTRGEWVSEDGNWECVGWRKTEDTEQYLEDIPEECREMTYEDEPVQIVVERRIESLKVRK